MICGIKIHMVFKVPGFLARLPIILIAVCVFCGLPQGGFNGYSLVLDFAKSLQQLILISGIQIDDGVIAKDVNLANLDTRVT